jgi:prolyl 4-hydroxylase
MKDTLEAVKQGPSISGNPSIDEALSQHRFISLLRAHGHDAVAICGELMSMGWHAKVAKRVVAEVLNGGGIANQIHNRRVGPDLLHLPSRLDLGDRSVNVQIRIHHPDICLVGDFLSATECESLIEQATPRLGRSRVILADGVQDENGEEAYLRTSEQASFAAGISELVDDIQNRVSRFTGWPTTHMESTI